MTERCVRVCTSSQGGLLDNPGLVTAGCANVLDKWDQVMSGNGATEELKYEAYLDSQKLTAVHYVNSKSH